MTRVAAARALRPLAAVACATAVAHAAAGPARAQSVTITYPAEAAPLRTVVVHGLDRTREQTVLELLPRPPPARYTTAELREFERRLANLGIFDVVKVNETERSVEVQLREKWTLIPLVDFSTGTSWADTYAAASLSEYNFLGRGMLLSADVWHADRGWNGALVLSEHPYRPRRGSFAVQVDYVSSSMQFEGADAAAWHRAFGGGGVLFRPKHQHGERLAYQIAASYHYEHNIRDSAGTRNPPDGNVLQLEFRATFDQFRWDDMAPHGTRLLLNVGPGALWNLRRVQPRLETKLQLVAAHAFSATGVLIGQFEAMARNRGNANFSTLVGSFDGVRGLPDGVYHAWLHGVANLELRQAWHFAERWALQGVAFADGALIDTVDAAGRREQALWAASAGLGVRLIPMFLAHVVLRIDVARAFGPDHTFFVQWGLSQYFDAP